MNMKKSISLLLALVLCLSLAACGNKNDSKPDANNAPPVEDQAPAQTPAAPEAPAEDQDGPRTVTDTTGRTFTVPEELERVVVLSAGECEIVYALGAGDLVVGRGEYCNYPEAVLDVPAVQSGSQTNTEQILALEPQVIIMSAMDQDPDQIAAFEQAGIAVCVSTETNIDGVYASIRTIGQVLGREEQAEAVVSDMQSRFDAIREKSKDKTGGTVYFEVSPLQYGLWSAGADTFMDEIAQMMGLTNIFADISGWGEVSQEQVLQRNPDIIITNAMYFGEGVLPVDEILSRPGWENVAAIKNGMVYNASSDQLSRPGPRLAEAAEMIFAFVYGE